MSEKLFRQLLGSKNELGLPHKFCQFCYNQLDSRQIWDSVKSPVQIDDPTGFRCKCTMFALDKPFQCPRQFLEKGLAEISHHKKRLSKLAYPIKNKYRELAKLCTLISKIG